MGSSLKDPGVNHTLVKQAVERNSYTVDPDRVASALIVKLVQETLTTHPPASCGPTPAAGTRGRLRRAA
jgi:hypothetical protein